METNKIIIDTDPGIDDAMAILFALEHPHTELLGLTTVFGNVPTKLATENALKILEIGGADLPVCEGEHKPLSGMANRYPDWVHGQDGLGNISWPKAKRKKDKRNAVDFIADTMIKHPGEITLVPIGPLTNIARLVTRRPEAVGLVRGVVVMGGAALCSGNVTPLAEANIANDPQSADIVFGASWPTVMVGLDVTASVVADANLFKQIEKTKPAYGQFLAKAAGHYVDFYSTHMGIKGCCLHDVCAVAHVLEPQLFTDINARIRVVCSSFARGKTAVMTEGFYHKDDMWTRRPMQKFSSGVNKSGLLNLFARTLKKVR